MEKVKNACASACGWVGGGGSSETSSSFAINRKDCSKDPSASSGGLCLRLRSSRSRFERCSAVISTKYHLQPLTRVEPRRENDVPVVYGTMDGSGDLFKDAVQSVVVGLFEYS